MKYQSIALLLIVAGLTGCATQKEWTATSGSRADGTVRLSYDYGAFEVPQVNDQQGTDIAKSRCIAWGYQEAEAFGGARQTCNNMTSSGCMGWMVTREYQCIGKGDSR